MTAEQGIQFLTALRAKNIRQKDNGWVEASCPLAKWLHKNHQDSNPSFGLSITPGDRSWFMCFSCRQGSAEELLSVLEMYTQASSDYDFAICHQILNDEQVVMPLPEYGEFHKAQQPFVEWPSYWLDSFTGSEWSGEVSDYLVGRGISDAEAAHFDLRYDPKRNMVVAPYRDVFGRLAGARGRAINNTVKLKHYDYSFQGINNARLVWYNEMVLNLPGPVVVVEGQFDCIKTFRAFDKTVANLTARPTLEKLKKLSDCGTVIQIPDRDEAGQQSIEVYAKHCHQLGLTHRVIHLDEGVKDPAECHPDYLRDKIGEALGI